MHYLQIENIYYIKIKLTWLLSDSLGGNTKTFMFTNVSPASFNYEETVGTLRYASRAKVIKNAPNINEDPKDALLRQYKEEIKMLKFQLAGSIPIGNNVVNDDNNDDKGNNDNNNVKKVNVNPVDDEAKKRLLEKIALLEKGMIKDVNKVIIQKEIEGESEKEKKERLKREEE